MEIFLNFVQIPNHIKIVIISNQLFILLCWSLLNCSANLELHIVIQNKNTFFYRQH